jgi:exonuclease SbcC
MRDQIATLEKRIEQNTKELGMVAVSDDAKPTLEKKIAGFRDLQSSLTTKRNTAENHLGRAQQQLEYCGRLEAERAKKLEDHKQAASERSTYEELATAFGKRGVQAMIIEAFLPEIERDANEILQRMTDNRMTIRLETQSQGRTNNAIETLDIQIGDELGTRNYEMFSGGEAFRINFAIRVALAKSLTRRAGAKLETLVVDEGFGTQDAAGRDRLVEAIHAIEDQFEKIIVVTHIDELKEVFPTRINVVKTAEGSTFSITHR